LGTGEDDAEDCPLLALLPLAGVFDFLFVDLVAGEFVDLLALFVRSATGGTGIQLNNLCQDADRRSVV